MCFLYVDDSASTTEPMDHYPAIQSASELREHFDQIAMSQLDHLLMSRTHANDVRRIVADLPFLSLSGKTDDPVAQGIGNIKNTRIVTDLFDFLHTNMWNFFDYHLLAHFVRCLGNDLVKDSMQQYISNFGEFEESTSLNNFFESWPGCKQKLPSYVSVLASIGGSLEHYTVAKLNRLRQYICDKYLPPQSHYAMLFYKHQREKMEVMWVIPLELAAILKKAIGQPETCEDLYTKFQVIISIPEIDVSPGKSTILSTLLASKHTCKIGNWHDDLVNMNNKL